MTREETIGGDRVAESLDGTLRVKVKDGTKVNRVLVWGDNTFGILYYPDRPQGKWIKEYNGDGWNDYWDYKCSNCGKVYKRAGAILYDANYCPNCSAKMGDTK